MKKNAPEITISVKVSEQSSNGWKQFCEKNGITLSAFIEVAGLQLLDETAPPQVEARQKMVEMSRKIDQQRRVRRK